MTEKNNLSIEQEDLSKALTDLQRRFIMEYIKPGTSQREAYLKAGGKAKKAVTQDAAASTMFGNIKVRAFYDSLVKKAENSAVLTRERALEILSTNAEEAEECKDQHTAIKQLSTMQGWDAPKKSEITGKDGGPLQVHEMSDAELEAIIARGKK